MLSYLRRKEEAMRKVILVALAIALLLVAAVPVLAQLEIVYLGPGESVFVVCDRKAKRLVVERANRYAVNLFCRPTYDDDVIER